MKTEPSGEAPVTRGARSPLQIILIVLAIALGLFVMYRAERVILVLILAVFFAYLLAPIVTRIERVLHAAGTPRGVSRGLAIGVVYLLLCGIAGAGASVLVPKLTQQVTDIASRAPEYTEALRSWSHRWSAYERAKLPTELRARVDESVLAASDAAVLHVRESFLAVLGMLAYLPWLVLIPVLAFFLLKDVDQLRYAIVYALPPTARGRGYQLVQELNTALYAYVRAQLLACLIVGLVCGLGFALLGVPYAVLLGVFAGILEFIPLIGPLVVALTAAIIAAVHAPSLAFWTCAFLVVVRVLEDYVVYPRLMGSGTHLHPLAIIVAVLAGAELGGVIGIFLAVPVAATLSVTYRHWAHWARSPGPTLRPSSTPTPDADVTRVAR